MTERCTFCTSKTVEAAFQKGRCRIPALSRGSNESFELNELIRQDATLPWPRGSRRRWKCLRRNASLHQCDLFLKSLLGGERSWSEPFLQAVHRSSAPPRLARALFYTRRPSANEKRQPCRAGCLWHLFMLTGQLQADMKTSPGLIRNANVWKHFLRVFVLSEQSTSRPHYLFLAAYFNENLGGWFYFQTVYYAPRSKWRPDNKKGNNEGFDGLVLFSIKWWTWNPEKQR